MYLMSALVVIYSFGPRLTSMCRHVMRFLHPGRSYGTKIPSPQLPLFPGLTNCNASTSFRPLPLRAVSTRRIRFYADCRVSPALFSSLSIFAPLPFHNSFAIMRFRTLLRFFAYLQSSNSLFSYDSALFHKNTGGGGTDSFPQRLQPFSARFASFPHASPYTR
jgi:hypothetical protein